MRTYLSGPMSGLPEENHPAFREATRLLRAVGRDIVSPVEVCERLALPTWTWQDFMNANLRALVGCQAIAMLPGWTQSRGALREFETAMDMGMTAYLYRGDGVLERFR